MNKFFLILISIVIVDSSISFALNKASLKHLHARRLIDEVPLTAGKATLI